MKSFRKTGTETDPRTIRRSSSEPWKWSGSVSTLIAAAPPRSYARACAATSTPGLMSPADGDARLISAIKARPGDDSARAKSRGGLAAAAASFAAASAPPAARDSASARREAVTCSRKEVTVTRIIGRRSEAQRLKRLPRDRADARNLRRLDHTHRVAGRVQGRVVSRPEPGGRDPRALERD